jgi:hypothetical protein
MEVVEEVEEVEEVFIPPILQFLQEVNFNQLFVLSG